MIPQYAADGVNLPSDNRNDENPLWRKSAAGVLSLLVHGALLAAFIGYTSSRSLSPVDTAGRAGSAMSVVAMSPPVAENVAAQPPTTVPVMLEPPVKTVVAENAEIVVAQKPVTPEKPIVKKSPPRQSKPVEKPRPAVEKAKPSAPVVVSAPSEAARPAGPVATEATSSSAGVSQPSSGSAQQAGESAAGNAAKGAGNTTSTRFRILHRRVNYPTRARSLGVEGQVRVKYDVTASGTVTNIQILAENPPDVFSSDLRRDISRWRYDTTGEIKNQVVTVVFKIDGRIQLVN